MKLSSPPTQLQQVQAHPDKDKYALVASYDADNATYAQEHRAAKSGLLGLCPAKMWHNNSYSTFCPRPILITQQHQQRLRDLHSGLGLALTDIVERWWTDAEARFPERMPLEPKEEALLQWIDAQSADVLPAFRERLGAWRPDFLVEKDAAGNENFRITEINARFCFNLMMYTGYGQEVLRGMGVTGAGNGLVGTTDLEHVVNSAMRLFDPQRRLHFVKGNEKGMDIHMFIDFMKRHLGLTPRLITPADLRLVPDPQSKTGFKLCCVAEEKASGPNPSLIASWKGETLEEIDQIGLELQQRELLALSPEMLQQISLQCFNDLRTVLLVHDKRMLGIIRQELPSLVERGVLTPYQADCLDRGIPESMPPGSPELMRFLQLCRASPDLKDAYLLKSVRSGKGDGIFFGDSMTPTEWVSRLEQQRCADLDPSNSSCIVQRKVCHMLYDVVLQESGEKLRYPLVGTYFSTGGEFLSLGVWRSSPDQVVAVFHGGSWACYVTTCD